MAEPPAVGPLRIEYLPLSALLRAPRNPKGHDLSALGESFARFGYVTPVILNETTGRLVAGHGRLDALEATRGRGEPPPERIQIGPDGGWLVPVVRGISFATDAEAESYLIADNRLAEVGGWDDAELARVLSDLAAQDALAGTGFDRDAMDALTRRLAGPSLGPELDESIADGMSLCRCPECGHEHHRIAE